MKYEVDIAKRKKEANRLYYGEVALLAGLIALLIGVNVLLLLLSPHNYIIYLIIDIAVSVLLIVAFLFVFLNLFPLAKTYQNFYKNINKTAYERARKLIYVGEKERKDIGNVSHRVLAFRYVEGFVTLEENVYVLDDDDLAFQEGDLVKVRTYRNVLMEGEVIDHASDE